MFLTNMTAFLASAKWGVMQKPENSSIHAVLQNKEPFWTENVFV